MIDLLILIILCSMFAYVIQNRTARYHTAQEGIRRDRQSRVLYFCIFISFIMFAGLRSSYNDTVTYIQGFRILESSGIKISILLEPYGGFELYQQILKKYVSDDPQVFIFVSALVTNLLYLRFYTRHTKRYSGMIFLYSIGIYLEGMAAIKQTIAVGIGFYAIEAYLDKKYLKAIFLLLIAATFHPYIICLICIPFLRKHVWDRKTIFVIIICIVAFMNMDKVFELLNYIGKDYSGEIFDDYTINPIRVLVESVPVIISYIYRKEINASNRKLLILGINMRIVSFVFISMGLFANPIYFGRMSSYFTALSVIAIPEMLDIAWKKNRNGKIYLMGYYVFFFIYFLMDMTKIGSISIFYDRFNHVPFHSLFAGKGN